MSVIVPTKDRPADLAACLDGLQRAAAASAQALEVVVVDDGADRARCRAVVQRAALGAPQVCFVYATNPGPPGAAGARNHGAARARGRILGFVDDDAVVDDAWVRIAAALCAPGTALTGRIDSLGDEDAFSRARQARYDKRHEKGVINPSVDYLAGGNSVVWRSDLCAVGGFDVAFEMMHDREVALRLVANGVTIRYEQSLRIRHRHFKGLGLYVNMTMRSGHFRRMLERRHSHAVGPWRPRDVVSSFRSTASTPDAKVVIAVSELLHGLGYLHERFFNETKGRLMRTEPETAAVRSGPFVRLDHVQLAMPEGQEAQARRFYGDVLGLEEVPKPPELAKRGGAWFRSGDVTVHLGVDRPFAPAKKAHPAFRCHDYEGMVVKLRASGVDIVPDDLPFEGKEHCYIADPFGNRIELIAV